MNSQLSISEAASTRDTWARTFSKLSLFNEAAWGAADARESYQFASSTSAARTRLVQAYEKMMVSYREDSRRNRPSTVITVSRAAEEFLCVVENSRLFHCERLEGFVSHGKKFQVLVAAVITLNAVFIGIVGDMVMRRAIQKYDGEDRSDSATFDFWVFVVDTIFSVFFLMELLIRIAALQGKFFFGDDRNWNLFDTLIVLQSVTELSLSFLGLTANYVQGLRVVRVVRSMRMLRIMRFTSLFRKLRIMIHAILNSSMLLWAMMVLLLVVYLFAMVFVDAVALYIMHASETNVFVDDMKLFFGSLPKTMLTLFMAVSGGIDWWEVVQLLLEIHPTYALFFTFFIIVTLLAVLNVISAIFVNDAMETTRLNPDLRMQMEAEETQFTIERLTELFTEMVGDALYVSSEDFCQSAESMESKMSFAMLGLHYVDAYNFFRIMDIDGSGEVGLEEFVMGCLRLKSGAIFMDIDVGIKESTAWIKNAMADQQKEIMRLSHSIHSIQQRLDIAPSSRSPSARSDRSRDTINSWFGDQSLSPRGAIYGGERDRKSVV